MAELLHILGHTRHKSASKNSSEWTPTNGLFASRGIAAQSEKPVPAHAARSTNVEETSNRITIRFRPTNAITMDGLLSISAPFGFTVPTDCLAVVRRLNPLGLPVSVVPHII